MATRNKDIRGSFKLTNKANVAITSGSLAITLPSDVGYTRSGSRPGASQQGVPSGNVVTWAATGSLSRMKSRTFWVDGGVDSDATALLFGAGAILTLGDGSTCEINAGNQVSVKGFKGAVLTSSYINQVVSSCIDAGSGYTEEVRIWSDCLTLFFARPIEFMCPSNPDPLQGRRLRIRSRM